MRSVEVEGGSIDDAIERALRALGAGRDQVEIDILENASRGVLGIGRRRARVRATIRAPLVLSASDGAAARHPVADALEGAAVDHPRRDGGAQTVRRSADGREFDVPSFLEGALQRMGVAAQVRAGDAVDGTRTLEIDGSDAQVLATCAGDVLAALELMVNRVADRHATERIPFRITLPDGGADDLPRRARRLAERVRRHRKPVTIEAADEHERRAWTTALQGERGVAVRLNGSRLVIVPQGRKGGGTAER